MKRLVEPELLDELAADDPRALRSRRDLRRVNAFMGTGPVMARAAAPLLNASRALRVAELGAGDGYSLHRVMRALGGQGFCGQLTLVDLNTGPDAARIQQFSKLGWRVESSRADVFEWLPVQPPQHYDLLLANLFLHHFRDGQLRRLLELCAGCSRAFIAVEPRRWKPAYLCSHALGLIGCNSVTRHDAVVSVRAGFAGREIGECWPSDGWQITETEANWSSHLFIARREAS